MTAAGRRGRSAAPGSKKRSFNNITVIIPSVPLLLAAWPKLSKDLPPLISPPCHFHSFAFSIATNFSMLYNPHGMGFNIFSISRNTNSDDGRSMSQMVYENRK